MPIYFGSPAIHKFFPEDAIILLDPSDPDAAAKIAEVARSDLWFKRRDAIREAKRRVLEDYNLFAQLARFISNYDKPDPPTRETIIRPVMVDFRKEAPNATPSD
jgi:hypothetical protein